FILLFISFSFRRWPYSGSTHHQSSIVIRRLVRQMKEGKRPLEMSTTTRLIFDDLLWIIVLSGTLAFIQHRLSDPGISLESINAQQARRRMDFSFGHYASLHIAKSCCLLKVREIFACLE
ncbi:unnamed protein product, partial [Linum tenue]